MLAWRSLWTAVQRDEPSSRPATERLYFRRIAAISSSAPMCASALSSSECIVLRESWVAPASRKARVLGDLVVVADRVLQPALELEVREVAARVGPRRSDDLERLLEPALWSRHGEPPVRDPADPAERRRREATDPDRDRALHRQRGQAGAVDAVELARRRSRSLPSRGTEHVDLLLQQSAALVEGHAERLVLQLFQPMPSPSRKRPPQRRSSSAACLASRAVCRCGPMRIDVANARLREAGEVREDISGSWNVAVEV